MLWVCQGDSKVKVPEGIEHRAIIAPTNPAERAELIRDIMAAYAHERAYVDCRESALLLATQAYILFVRFE